MGPVMAQTLVYVKIGLTLGNSDRTAVEINMFLNNSDSWHFAMYAYFLLKIQHIKVWSLQYKIKKGIY